MVPALAVGRSLNSLPCSMTCPLLYSCSVWSFVGFFCFFLTAFSHFLALQDAPGFSCIFSTPVLESVISPGNPGSSYWRKILASDLGGRCTHFYWGVISSKFSQLTEQSGKCVCTYICVCMYIFIDIYLCNQLYLYLR